MNLFPFLHFFSFVVYLFLAGYIRSKNPKASLNRVCSVLFLCPALWSLGNVFIHNLDATKEIARAFENISVVGWASFQAFFLWFIFVFTKKEKLLKKKVFYIAIFTIPALLIYKQWTSSLIVDYTRQYYGWAGVWSSSIWAYLHHSYSVVFLGTGIYALLSFLKKAKQKVRKKQAKIILYTTIIAFAAGFITDVLLPRMGVHAVPDVADVIILIWAMGLLYSVAKYNFLSMAELVMVNERLQREVNERRKAEETLRESEQKYSALVEKSNDGIIMIQDGLVKFANSKMEEFTGFNAEKSIGKPFIDFISPEFRKYVADMYKKRIERKEVVSRYEVELLSKGGKTIPIEINASLIEYEGKLADMAIVRDITQRKRTAEELKESNRRLAQTVESIIYSMVRVVETRDPYTAGHQNRVAQLACAIAREMKLSKDRIKGIHMASIVHDIGKVSIPSEILNKPRKLTKIEFSIIQTHVETGYEILKTIEFPWPIAEIVLQHHERMDGSGYPLGISKRKMLLETDILCVADVVEAMMSHRPYRPALGLKKALDEIKQKRGTLYASKAVDACLKLFSEKKFEFKQNGDRLNVDS